MEAPIPPSDVATASKDSEPSKRVEAAEQHKTKGNAEFQAGNMEAAKKEYEKALRKLGQASLGVDLAPADESAAVAIEQAGEDLATRSKACRVPAQLNLALCCLRAEPCDAGRALQLCESVLDDEPENAKAMYRKSKALIELEILDEAEWELTRACKLLPKDVNVRNDLQKLRQRRRDMKAAEKKTYEGCFSKGAGFASEGRETKAAAPGAAPAEDARRGFSYTRLKKPEENPYATSTQPAEEALALQDCGKLEEAIWALEAALDLAQANDDCEERCRHWLELGRLYMDVNIDSLALVCLADAVQSQEGKTRQHGLLLSAICLLNEAESDPEKEVSQAITAWVSFARPDIDQSVDLDEQLQRWRDSNDNGADVAVAHGLLHLVHGRPDDALQDFAAALRAPEDEAFYFGSPRRQATKWNMLGAVLANRTRHREALAVYDRALRVRPHYPRALFNQGIALEATSKNVKAAASVAKALAITPSWCWPPLWAILEKASGQVEDAEFPGLAEAAKEMNLGKVQEILGSEVAVLPADTSGSVEEVLGQMVLAPKSTTDKA